MSQCWFITEFADSPEILRNIYVIQFIIWLVSGEHCKASQAVSVYDALTEDGPGVIHPAATAGQSPSIVHQVPLSALQGQR